MVQSKELARALWSENKVGENQARTNLYNFAEIKQAERGQKYAYVLHIAIKLLRHMSACAIALMVINSAPA